MKNLRRLVVSLAVLLVALLCLTATVSAAEITHSGTCGKNLTWTLDDEGTLTISGEGKMSNYENKTPPWRELDVRKVVVESGVTSIGDYAFEADKNYLNNLTQISLPSTLKTIGYRSFAGSRIEHIKIPNSVVEIYDNAFEYSYLSDVTLPNKLEVLSQSIFESCNALEKIVIPESVTELGWAAFRDCRNLKEVQMPSKLKLIDHDAFRKCVSLEYVVLPDSVSSIGGAAFMGCTSLQGAYLPASLSVIDECLFMDCTALEEVYLPAKLEAVKQNAFNGCDSLAYVYFLGDEEQLAQIQVGSNNDPLLYANAYLVTMVTKEPEDAYVQEGETVKFSTDTSRAGTTYQWYYLAPGADEWKVCKQSGAKTKTLTVTATKDLDGYYFCCEITDVYGSVGETRAALLTIVEPPKITTQPKNAAAPEGSTAKVTVKAKGDGLSYQWYIKNAGKDKFSKSSVTSATYSCKMSEKTDGRQVYCVVTDQYGNTVKSKTVTLYMGNPAKITTQPSNVAAPEGKVAKATVKATGDDITYTWYIKNPGKSSFSKSSVTSATYSCKMSEKTDGRQAYCVITDKYGTSVKTDTVTFYMGNPIKITTQPKNAVAAEGKTAKATVKATGDGLTYQWYIKNPGKAKFGKSSVTSATYSCKMSESTDGRQAYCVITDEKGMSVQTDTVTFYMGKPARITTQPRDAIAPAGEKVKTTVKATGDGITYQWYIKNPGKTKFSKSSVTSATYSCKMSESIDGRQAYCVVTDKYGTSVQSKTVTLSIGNPVAIVTQPQSVSAAAGETAKTTVEATGEGLTYQWYIRNPGKEKFGKSSVTSATYSCKVSETTDGREAYCVITDKYGNSVQSETVTITMEAEDVHVHTPKTVNTLPTCTSAGQTKTFCTECNEVLELVDNPEQPALGHDWVEISNTATCTEGGTKTSQCSRCDETISESSAAIGHVNTHAEIQKATCTEDGWEKIICDDCGIQIGSTTILAARGSHSYETAVLADAAKDYSSYEGSNKYDAYLEYSDISCQRCKDCYIIDENSFAYRYSAEEVTTMMLSYVNALRKENGLSELTAGESMIALADERAEEIAFNFTQATEHTENAAQAVVFSDCIQHFYNLFAESAAQSANMLAEDAVTFGCAIYYNNGVVYCVQVFE